MKISGTAKIVIDNCTHDTSVEIDAVRGIVKCFPKIPFELGIALAIKQQVSLVDFKADIVNGVVYTAEIKNLILMDWVEGDRMSRLKQEIQSIEGRQEYYFKLYHSKLELSFDPYKTFKNQTELHYSNCLLESKFEITIKGIKGEINTDNSGDGFFIFNKNLSEKEFETTTNIIRTSFFMAQGYFPRFQEMITPNKLVINLIGYKTKGKSHHFVDNHGFQNLTNAVIKFLSNLSGPELQKFNNTIYYFANGINNDILLEHRCISLFVACEIIDKSKTLNKNSLKKHLQLNALYDAAYLIKLRNGLIHSGLSIKKAIEEIDSIIQETDKDVSELETFFSRNIKKKHISIYFFMVDKLYQYLITKIGYSGKVKLKCESYL